MTTHLITCEGPEGRGGCREYLGGVTLPDDASEARIAKALTGYRCKAHEPEQAGTTALESIVHFDQSGHAFDLSR
ncbi:MAG: hypothetical protein V4472_25125 [Pseudomonadota bacterium]